MPRILRNEYRPTLLDRVAHFIQNESSATFDDVESLVHFEVSMNRDTNADQDLLGSHDETVRAPGGVHFDEDVPATLNEMFALARTEHITLWRHQYLPIVRAGQRNSKWRDCVEGGSFVGAMSALGHELPLRDDSVTSALPPITDMRGLDRHVQLSCQKRTFSVAAQWSAVTRTARIGGAPACNRFSVSACRGSISPIFESNAARHFPHPKRGERKSKTDHRAVKVVGIGAFDLDRRDLADLERPVGAHMH
jgi:hypothetical protein